SLLRRITLPVAEATRLVAILARALSTAHRAGICHGDVKPENVILGSDGTPRLIDLGLARHVGDGGTPYDGNGETTRGRITGTPGYLAPECWTGLAPTGAADVCALGAVWFESITGERPWRATSATVTAEDRAGWVSTLRPLFSGPFAAAE